MSTLPVPVERNQHRRTSVLVYTVGACLRHDDSKFPVDRLHVEDVWKETRRRRKEIKTFSGDRPLRLKDDKIWSSIRIHVNRLYILSNFTTVQIKVKEQFDTI